MERTNAHLEVKAMVGLAHLTLVMGVLAFLPAGTWQWPEAWVFLGIFFACSLAITIYLMKQDPKLLERRVQAGPVAEKERSQKIIQVFATLSFLSTIVVPGLDRRFGWSHVRPAVIVLGDALVAVGFWVVFAVFRENTFTSATIEVAAEQRVIESGPYARVRHPMYAGALLLIVGIPLALQSYWGLFTVAPMVASIVWRLLDEEAFLAKRLPGYDAYRRKVAYRLLPGVW